MKCKSNAIYIVVLLYLFNPIEFQVAVNYQSTLYHHSALLKWTNEMIDVYCILLLDTGSSRASKKKHVPLYPLENWNVPLFKGTFFSNRTFISQHFADGAFSANSWSLSPRIVAPMVGEEPWVITTSLLLVFWGRFDKGTWDGFPCMYNCNIRISIMHIYSITFLLPCHWESDTPSSDDVSPSGLAFTCLSLLCQNKLSVPPKKRQIGRPCQNKPWCFPFVFPSPATWISNVESRKHRDSQG